MPAFRVSNSGYIVVSSHRRTPAGQRIRSLHRRAQAKPSPTGVTTRWRFGDRVDWREYTAVFYRTDPEDSTYAYIMVAGRTYRVPLGELK